MSAVLTPCIHQSGDVSPRRRSKKSRKPTVYSNPKHPPPKFPVAHCEKCYCRETPEPPLINLRTKTSPEKRQNHCCPAEESNEGAAKSQELLDQVHWKVDYVPRTLFLKRLQEEAHKNCPRVGCGGVNGGGFTSRREEYEELAEQKLGSASDALNSVANVANRVQCSDGGSDVSARGRLQGDICKKTDGDCDCPKCRDQKTLADNVKKVPSIKDFRAKNFFETHSTSDLIPQKIENHKCVHRLVM